MKDQELTFDETFNPYISAQSQTEEELSKGITSRAANLRNVTTKSWDKRKKEMNSYRSKLTFDETNRIVLNAITSHQAIKKCNGLRSRVRELRLSKGIYVPYEK